MPCTYDTIIHQRHRGVDDMVKKVACEHSIYAFDKNNKPVERVRAGESITIETYDCFTNQITSEQYDLAATLDWEKINPATGPIFVEDAHPGDILKVTIDELNIGQEGIMVTGNGIGVLGDQIDAFDIKVCPVEDDQLIFNDSVKIPLNKMIGVIGVAPEGDPVNCGIPGAHGGNLDTKLITEGATLYFPVFQEGALFATGDFHAAMGDGEIGGSGMETPGDVTVTFDVIKGKEIKHPLLQNEHGVSMIATAETLDEAAKTAVREMITLLQPHTDLSLAHMTMLMGAVGQTEVSQIVNPQCTARFTVPQQILDAYHIDLFK